MSEQVARTRLTNDPQTNATTSPITTSTTLEITAVGAGADSFDHFRGSFEERTAMSTRTRARLAHLNLRIEIPPNSRVGYGVEADVESESDFSTLGSDDSSGGLDPLWPRGQYQGGSPETRDEGDEDEANKSKHVYESKLIDQRQRQPNEGSRRDVRTVEFSVGPLKFDIAGFAPTPCNTPHLITDGKTYEVAIVLYGASAMLEGDPGVVRNAGCSRWDDCESAVMVNIGDLDEAKKGGGGGVTAPPSSPIEVFAPLEVYYPFHSDSITGPVQFPTVRDGRRHAVKRVNSAVMDESSTLQPASDAIERPKSVRVLFEELGGNERKAICVIQ